MSPFLCEDVYSAHSNAPPIGMMYSNGRGAAEFCVNALAD